MQPHRPFRAELIASFDIEKLQINEYIEPIKHEIAQVYQRAFFMIRFTLLLPGTSLIFLCHFLMQLYNVPSMYFYGASVLVALLCLGMMVSTSLIHAVFNTSLFGNARRQLRSYHREIEMLRLQAEEYRALREPEGYVGTLCLFEDIVRHPDFKSTLNPITLQRNVKLSFHGKGSRIPLDEYRQAMEGLKNFDFDAYAATTRLPLEHIAHSHKFDIAKQCACAIASSLSNTSKFSMPETHQHQVAKAGMHASNSFKILGRPSKWNHKDDSVFDYGYDLFNAVLHSSPHLPHIAEKYLLVHRESMHSAQISPW